MEMVNFIFLFGGIFMKKRLFWILAFISLLICILSACGTTSSNDVDKAALEMSNFKCIDGVDYLVYNSDTLIIYYIFSTSEKHGSYSYGYSYFAPYISENGKFCKYVNNEIIEIR